MTLRHLVASFLAASAALFLAPVIPASAHEVGAIHLSSHQVSVGGSVTVRGEKLPKSEPLTLELRGVLDNYPVGSVHTDTAGAFEMSLTVPQNVPAGPYTLVVIASDGDVTARADLVVGAAATAAAPAAGTAPSGNMADMPGMSGSATSGTGERATAAVMSIANPTTPGEWLIIWVLILASLAGGIALLRRAAPTTHHDP
jgi:hypothetical protein